MMAAKRPHSPELIPNPFIKKRNLEWSIEITSLARGTAETSDMDAVQDLPSLSQHDTIYDQPTASAIEAGRARVEDHLTYFSALLSKYTLSPVPPATPHVLVNAYAQLYISNVGNPSGAHFVIHQHDHPIAGTHYDLRLQINENSSASWAIMYGLPGAPNGERLNRNATETRVHCLWNHLVETSSHATGSLLIWDTGTYTVLPVDEPSRLANSQSSQSEGRDEDEEVTEQEKLRRAFAARKIKLRLHGLKLPKNYALNLRLTRDEDVAGRARSTRVPKTRRRRGDRPSISGRKRREAGMGSDSEREDGQEAVHAPVEADQAGLSATERELRELDDETVRQTNAYPGAANSIGSVYQRRWYLSLDRAASGFVRRRKGGRMVWEPGDEGGAVAGDGDHGRLTYPFYVRGVENERSIVTGRLGADVLRDDGVEGYVGRKGWMPVLR
ncbi:hypothetical protein F5Y15DRAFT_292780 [Xylariaceae sp. FL0016]|nr:hypothetical protein F5Y15DRAFT_292780 [Xylariaceae sp. FL0016]